MGWTSKQSPSGAGGSTATDGSASELGVWAAPAGTAKSDPTTAIVAIPIAKLSLVGS
jgi:hypothetical protein